MTYQWKLNNMYRVDAQVAGEEIERIGEKYGEIQPEHLVDESRDEAAPMHKCFEWDDAVAAEEYRLHQARRVIGHLVVVAETRTATPAHPTRAFVRVQNDYKPISVVVKDKDLTTEMLERALLDLRAFRAKYQSLSSLAKVFNVIDEVLKDEVTL